MAVWLLEWPEAGSGGAWSWADLLPCVGHSRWTASTCVCWPATSLVMSLEAEVLICWVWSMNRIKMIWILWAEFLCSVFKVMLYQLLFKGLICFGFTFSLAMTRSGAGYVWRRERQLPRLLWLAKSVCCLCVLCLVPLSALPVSRARYNTE